MSWSRRGVALHVVLVAAGCPPAPNPVEPTDPDDCPPLHFPAGASPAPRAAARAPGGPATNLVCGEWLCQTNAASVGDGLYFYELDASGAAPNDQGVWYRSFTAPDGGKLTLDVQGSELRGTRGTGPDQYLFLRQNLVGATMILERDSQRYEVKIAAAGQVRFWVGPELECAPTYTFEYRKLPKEGPGEGPFHSMCSGLDLGEEWDRPGITSTLALVFAGDQYDARKKTVAPPRAGAWFNVACAGSALAKMHLLRHTEAGSYNSTYQVDPPNGPVRGPYVTTFDQRQAMFKMLTDDICGTGRSFTMDGEPVFYADVRQWHPLDFSGRVPRNGRLEALWDRYGAICLDEARRFAEDKNIVQEIAKECRRPLASCGYNWSDWPNPPAGRRQPYGISVNP